MAPDVEQRIKELQYLQDAIRSATTHVEFHLREIEKLLTSISNATKDYMETWHDTSP